jgi:DNA-directed RNA polymerase alpha subunit
MRFKFDLFLSDEMMNSSIEVLNLSRATYAALMRHGIQKVADVVNRWDDIQHLRGVGEKKIKEVRSAVFCANIEDMTERQLKQFIADFRIVEGDKDGGNHFTAA